MSDIRDYETMMKVSLDEDERKVVSECINMLLKSFKGLKNIDTSGVEPLIGVLDVEGIMREDIMARSIDRGRLLSNAPQQYDGYFQVPKTVD